MAEIQLHICMSLPLCYLVCELRCAPLIFNGLTVSVIATEWRWPGGTAAAACLYRTQHNEARAGHRRDRTLRWQLGDRCWACSLRVASVRQWWKEWWMDDWDWGKTRQNSQTVVLWCLIWTGEGDGREAGMDDFKSVSREVRMEMYRVYTRFREPKTL